MSSPLVIVACNNCMSSPRSGEDQVRWIPLEDKKSVNVIGSSNSQTHVVCQARVNTPFVSWDRPLSLYVKGATAGIALEPFFYFFCIFLVSSSLSTINFVLAGRSLRQCGPQLLAPGLGRKWPREWTASRRQNFTYFDDASYNEMVIDGALRIVICRSKFYFATSWRELNEHSTCNSFRELRLPYTRGQVIETQSISRASILSREEVEFLLETIKNY